MVTYPVAIVTQDFLQSNDSWQEKSIAHYRHRPANNNSKILSLHEEAANFARVDNIDCMNRVVDPLKATGDVVLVSTTLTKDNSNTSILIGFISGEDGRWWNAASNWICSAYEDEAFRRNCDFDFIKSHADDWQYAVDPHHHVTVDHCLIGPEADNEERCGYHFSVTILILVCTCAGIESALVLLVAFQYSTRTMVTLGDAVSEFLEFPDESTAPDLAPQNDMLGERKSLIRSRTALWSTQKRVRWYSAVKTKWWIFTVAA